MGISRKDYFRQRPDGVPDLRGSSVEDFIAKLLTSMPGAVLSAFHNQSATDNLFYREVGIAL